LPVERKEQDRVRLMDAFLKETQAFSVLFRLGILSRDEWREWLRQEYNVPLAPPVKIDGDGVPDMSDIAGLPEFVASLVDGRVEELFTADEGADGRPEGIVQAEMGVNGSQADAVPEHPVDDGDVEIEPLTDDTLQRLAEEDH
jgi:hypothetical protein